MGFRPTTLLLGLILPTFFDDGDLLSAQDAALSGQVAQQWKLCTMAQEAALEGVASSKLRLLSA